MPVVSNWTPRRPDKLGPAGNLSVPAPLARVSTVSSSSPSLLLPLVLALAGVIALLSVALALLPMRALPRQVVLMVYDRREAMIMGGFGMALAIFVGLAITLLGR